MKTPRFPFPTSPTPSDQPEIQDPSGPPRRFGISFPVAFLLVLGLHCAGVAAIYAYSSIKPKPMTTASPEVAEVVPGPKSDALAANEWPKPDGKPQIVAAPTPPQVSESTPKPVVAQTKGVPPAATRVVEQTSVKPRKAAPAAPAKASVAKVDNAPNLRKEFLAAAGKTSPVKAAQAAAEAVRRETPPVSARPAPAVVRAQPAPEAAPKSAPASTGRVAATRYTLAPGDNLYMVSRKLGVSYQDLARANGISDPRQLRVGQTLKVPSVASL